MRKFVSACLTVFCLLTHAVSAFEIEDRRTYSSEETDVVLRVISTADISAFEPLIKRFRIQNPLIGIEYTVASSTELMNAMLTDPTRFDLAISSAMDLQTKLTNDGFAQSYQSNNTAGLPNWAKWRDQLFAFTKEPATLVVSKTAFQNLPIPSSRDELIELLRANPDVFDGRIGTYDVRSSGLGYLFSSQDSRNTDTFWRLTEIMGRLRTKLYCCSGDMIKDVANGDLVMAYNVLGSYSLNIQKTEPRIRIIQLQDYSTIMMRTAFITKTAKNAGAAGQMIDFLVSPSTQADLQTNTGLPPILAEQSSKTETVRPIRLGPGLLVFLDKLKRRAFLRNWESSILQQNGE